jgi:hypothetical protein
MGPTAEVPISFNNPRDAPGGDGTPHVTLPETSGTEQDVFFSVL